MSTKESSILEDFVFKLRPLLLAAFVVLTGFFAYQATFVQLSTEFEKMVPLKHEFIQNLLKHQDDMSLGNDIRIAIETTDGDIFQDDFLQVLKQVTDEAFYLKGVDKAKIQSLWTPNVRWMEVTEDGFRGGEIMPAEYDGSEKSLKQVQANVLRSGQVGRLVADDFKSAIVYVPLVDQRGTGIKIDYKEFADALEAEIRDKYQSEKFQIHIVGFAKKIGDLIEGATGVALFFLIAIAITFVLLLLDSKSFRTTLIVITCSVTAVFWQVGILTLLGKGIDPYSMLVPFLIFAIGVSHGVQLINEFAVESFRVNYKVEAARLTFRALYIPALLALVSDAIGFMTLN
ncbi:MAG: MMPL family transporter, partial [Pseudomonadales bacterium]|nr:MMPL family transporter [Pseudomonadales bacterium]